MKLSSKYLGEIEFEENEVIHFPDGIPAFEQFREFLLLPMGEETPFFCLQDIKEGTLCLFLVDPFTFFPDYRVEILQEQMDKLACQESDDSVAVFSILTIPEDFKKTTANLMAPVLINFNNKKGLQFIPAKSDYTTKHLIFTEKDQAAAAKER